MTTSLTVSGVRAQTTSGVRQHFLLLALPPPSLGGAWRVQACKMVKKVTKPEVQKLSDLQVNTLSRLYGLPYNSRGWSVSEKAERVWGELVQ